MSTTKFQQFLENVHELYDLQMASAIVGLDTETSMPIKGVKNRTKVSVALQKAQYEFFTSDAFYKSLEEAEAETSDCENGSFEKRLITITRRELAHTKALPKEFQIKKTQFSGESKQAWKESRKNNDFKKFAPYLQKSIEYCQEMAEYYGYEEQPYDALLNTYEFGATTKEVAAILDELKKFTLEILPKIRAKGHDGRDKCLQGHFPVELQKSLCHYLASAIGFDFQAGALGIVTHPYCSKFSKDDVRINTRYNVNFFNASVFATMHEAGHGIYEQNIKDELTRTLLAKGTSLGVHESQSRLFENVVGRSLPFWEKHYPYAQSLFYDQLKNTTVHDFYKAINTVKESPIRVEADEITYNLHIILRFELELDMLKGNVKAVDLPDAWSQKTKQYLNLTPQNDSVGCMQDVHWSRPGFGYFPTYSLGNLCAAQLRQTAFDNSETIRSSFANGDPMPLKNWLHQNVHQYGKLLDAKDLILKATGKPLGVDGFKKYITEKYKDLYSI